MTDIPRITTGSVLPTPRITTVTVVSPEVNCPIVICPPTELEAAARQALEALELAQLNGEAGLRDYEVFEIAKSAEALRAALKEKA